MRTRAKLEKSDLPTTAINQTAPATAKRVKKNAGDQQPALPSRKTLKSVEVEETKSRTGTGQGVSRAKLQQEQIKLPALEGGDRFNPVKPPKTQAVTLEDVAAIADASRVLGKLLRGPGLAQQIFQVAAASGKRSAELERLIGAYAVLSDTVIHAPSYRDEPFMFAETRLSYRRPADGYERYQPHAEARRESSRGELRAGLKVALEQRDPIAALEKLLAERFLAEIGLDVTEAKRIQPTTAAVIDALKHELLVPMRAINELRPSYDDQLTAAEKRAMGLAISKSVLEGHFDEYRSGSATSKKQLAVLPPAMRKKWLEGMELEQTLVSADKKKLSLTTRDVSGLELFWTTKVGGPSHGFDSFFPECVLAVLSNARNGIIMLDDPRWPTGMARAYFRLVQDAKGGGGPVLYLENPQRDFEYVAWDVPDSKLILRHAIERAKQLGAELIVESGYRRDAEELGVKVADKPRRVVFAPSALLEAGTVMGPHHMRQQKPETVDLHYALSLKL